MVGRPSVLVLDVGGCFTVGLGWVLGACANFSQCFWFFSIATVLSSHRVEMRVRFGRLLFIKLQHQIDESFSNSSLVGKKPEKKNNLILVVFDE